MRYIDFDKLKDILHLVSNNNGKLRAGTLEKKAIEIGILLRTNGNEMTHTPRYHYRKVLEHLGLVQNIHGYYYINEDPKILRFLEITAPNEIIAKDAKNILKEIIINNNDCRKYFFDIFSNNFEYTLEDLEKHGTPAFVLSREIETHNSEKKNKIIVLRNSFNKEIQLDTNDKIQAVFWGVRFWALHLGVTNELMVNYVKGRVIYPVNYYFEEKNILNNLAIFIDKSDKWSLIHLPSFIEKLVINYRYSIEDIQRYLYALQNKYPREIMLIPTSTAFIDIKTPYQRQDSLIRTNSYLYKDKKGYISHLRIKNEWLRGIL